jgi:hypothetical protein
MSFVRIVRSGLPLAEDEVLLIMELEHVADTFGKDEKPKMVNRINVRANYSAPGLLP